MLIISKPNKKHNISAISKKLKTNEITKNLREAIPLSANISINEKQLEFIFSKCTFLNDKPMVCHTILTHIINSTILKDRLTWNLAKQPIIKTRKTKTSNEHERFFRNLESVFVRPIKDISSRNYKNHILEIFIDFLEKKDCYHQDRIKLQHNSSEDDYFKIAYIQTLTKKSIYDYKQLQNLLKMVVKCFYEKTFFSLKSTFLKSIIPINLFHIYTVDDDENNRIVKAYFSFSITSIHQLREAVFHSINSKNLIKNEIKFSRIN